MATALVFLVVCWCKNDPSPEDAPGAILPGSGPDEFCPNVPPNSALGKALSYTQNQ
jgi:hypothetical protein